MFLIKKFKNLYKGELVAIKRDYSIDAQKFYNANNTTHDKHPCYIDLIFRNGKYDIINVNYTHTDETLLNSEYVKNKLVGYDLNGKKSYIVIDDIIYNEIKSVDDANRHIEDIRNKYKDKNVTQYPQETHQAIRDSIKKEYSDESIEFKTPVAQDKQEYISIIENMRDNGNFNEVNIINNIQNKID